MQTTTSTVGLCLLPSDLLHDIFLRLPLPYLHRLRSVSTSLTSLLTSRDFRRLHRSLSDSTWLFLLTKRPPSRSSLLRGFHRRSLRWFTFPHLPSALDNDLYFLSASGNFFLFTSNSLLRLVAVDLSAGTARALPLCPLGPRGTSSWRRSGFKLLSSSSSSSSSSFRFLFAELHRGRPTLFEYSSATDAWLYVLAESSGGGQQVTRGGGGRGTIFLNVSDFVLAVAGVNEEEEEAVPVPPVVYYYTPRMLDGIGAVGRLHVYGDGMAAVVSTVVVGGGPSRRVTSVELWGPRRGGGQEEWEMVTRVPEGLFGSGINYGVMKGCLEERDGVVWLVLVSNLRGDWAIVWLGYHKLREVWEWVPVADPGAKGFNMAGIAVGTSFLGHWPSSSSSFASSSSSSSSATK